MAKLNWDVDGTRKFHAGVSHGVVYPKADGEGYDNGAAWNGLNGKPQRRRTYRPVG